MLGNAIYRAIVAVSKERESRKLLARELGLGMARVMPTCYAEILKDLRVHPDTGEIGKRVELRRGLDIHIGKRHTLHDVAGSRGVDG